MSNFYNNVIQQQYEYGRQIQNEWNDYYSKYNLETMKERQSSFLPSTPIIASIGQLNETLLNMENQLNTRTENETEQGRQARIKDSVQRQYDKLIDQFSKFNDAGILGKEHTLQSLLANKPVLNAYIRSHIVPKSVEELITLANDDPELNALIPEVLEKIPSKYSAKGKTPTPTIMAPSSAVSDAGGIQEAIRNVEIMRNNFLQATNRKGLPPDLDILYSYIHDLLDNGINTPNDERALKEAVFNFGKNLTDDLPVYKRDDTDMFIDSDSNTSRLTIKDKPNADEQNDDYQQEKKKVVVQRNPEDPDYFSVVNLTESNNMGDNTDNTFVKWNETTKSKIKELDNFFDRIPQKTKGYKKIEEKKDIIKKALEDTNKLQGTPGAKSKKRNKAIAKVNEFINYYFTDALPEPKKSSSASSLTEEALKKVAKGRNKNKKNKDKKEIKKEPKKDIKIQPKKEPKKEPIKRDVQKRQRPVKFEKAKFIESIKELPPKKKAFLPLNFVPNKVSFVFHDNALPKGISFN